MDLDEQFCGCICHAAARADRRHDLLHEQFADAHVAAQRAKREGPVSTSDVVAAAVACDLCRDRHAPALSGPPPPLYVWRGTPLTERQPPAIASPTFEPPTDDGN